MLGERFQFKSPVLISNKQQMTKTITAVYAQRQRKICYHAMKAYKGKGGITPPINFTAWRRWVVIFTSRPLCPLWRLCFASELVWAIWKREKSLIFVGIRTPDRSACNVGAAVYGKCVLCGAKINCRHHWKYLGVEEWVILRRVLENWNKNEIKMCVLHWIHEKRDKMIMVSVPSYKTTK
jgi:hypothetical protein